MNIGVIGHKGFLGRSIFEYFRCNENLNVYGISSDNWEQNKGIFFDFLIDADGNSSKIIAERNPVLDLDRNVMNVSRALEFFNFGTYVLISTIDVYNQRNNPLKNSEDADILPLKLSNYGFSKYVRELLVRRKADRWIIFRLAGIIGDGMKKGPLFDILNDSKLYISKESKLQLISTTAVSEIIGEIMSRKINGQIFNLAGEGQISMAEIASIAGIDLKDDGILVDEVNVSVDKIKRLCRLPPSREEVISIIERWKLKNLGTQ